MLLLLLFMINQTAPLEKYGNPTYSSNLPASESAAGFGQYYGSEQQMLLPQSTSIGTLAQLSSSTQLSKTDSHAVLMELFARDQDLVRQATESARLKAESKTSPGEQGGQQQQPQQQPAAAPTSQHPMMKAPSGSILGVPSLNSWPHFSSITSLNNLGNLPGVKSISSLSGVDLASKGNLNRMGNIAQVKSMESMGKNDSYAFLEVFFGDRSSTNLSGMGGAGSSSKGMMGNKLGDEDNEIGLSLEDETPSHHIKHPLSSMGQSMAFGSTISPSIGQGQQDSSPGAGSSTLKRAYDDALAARGLMAVSRSCENLTDLVLPAKIQRTLSQEFINMEQEQQVRQQVLQQQQAQQLKDQQEAYSQHTQAGSHQYPGQQAMEPQDASDGGASNTAQSDDGHVQVSSSTACAFCSQTNIDTQLRPCGHMFHERCLQPSLSNPNGLPKCPIDDIPIHSAVLAIPESVDGNDSPILPGSFLNVQRMDAV